MTRLLAIASAFVVPENRSVFKSLADDYGFDVTLVSPASWLQSRYGATEVFRVKPEEKEGYRVIPLRLTTGTCGRYRDLVPEIRRSRPRIVVCAQEFNSFATIHSLFLARIIARWPLTMSCSLQNIPYSLNRLRHRVRKCASFAASDVILASCTDAANVLKSRGYRGRIEVTYPLGAAAAEGGYPPKTTTRHSPFTVGFVGRIAAEKGVFDLIDAWARIEGTARLLFVGGGPDRARLESRIAELGLTSRVDFAGLVPRSEMAAYYGGMDALVIPSLSTPFWKEQFGVVLAEAMLMGVPVVGSNSGAIPEVIGDAGLIFPEGDVSALVTCLNVLRMNLVKRRDFSMRGLARAQALYTPKAMAAQLVEIFSNMGAI